MNEKEPKPSPEDNEIFEEQFNNPVIKEIYGGELEVYDIIPEELKTNIPTIVAPGWSANAELFKDNMRELSKRGRRSLSFGNYHGVKTNQETPLDIPNVEWRKIAALMGTIESKKIEKADVIAHSEGAIYTLLAAKMYPEKFRNIVLVNPAGFIEGDSALKLTARFSLDVGKQYLRAALNGNAYSPALGRVGRARTKQMGSQAGIRLPPIAQAVKHLGPEPTFKQSATAGQHAGRAIKKNPIAALKQVFAISSQDMISTLDDLQKQGVNVSILHSASDKAFPRDKVRNATAGKVRQFKTGPGSHNEIYLSAGKFTRAAERMLTAMERQEHSKDT